MPEKFSLLRTRVDRRTTVISSYVKRFDVVFEPMLSNLFGEKFPNDRPYGWVMWTLENGGFYLSPILPSGCLIESISGPSLSPDAAGIAASLMVFKKLSVHTEDYDRVMFDELYAALMEWAAHHAEVAEIRICIE